MKKIPSSVRLLALAAALAFGLGLMAGTTHFARANPPQQLPVGPVPLPVPYVSQMYWQSRCGGGMSINGRNNCAPASLAMVIEANGVRPAGLADRDFVARVREDMTGIPDQVCQDYTNWDQLDHGAAAYGLQCPSDTTATSLDDMKIWNDVCIPVIALIDPTDPSARSWVDNPDLHLGDHFIVIVGVRNGYVWYLNPLIVNADGSVPSQTYQAMRTTTAAKMAQVLAASEGRTKGRAYGRPLAGCDNGGCGLGPSGGPGGGGGGGGSGGTATPPPPDEVFDRVEVSMGSACPDKEVQLFYIAGSSSGFSERRSLRKWLRQDSLAYAKITFDMESRENWHGVLKQLRLDPTGTSTDCDVGFSWVNVASDEGGSAEFYDFYNHADDPGRPLNRLLGWTAVHMSDYGPRSSWQLHVDTLDPQIVNNDVDVDTGR